MITAAQAGKEPTPHTIVEAFNDWSYYKKEGDPVGRMLAHEAAKVSFIAGAKWALALSSAERCCPEGCMFTPCKVRRHVGTGAS